MNCASARFAFYLGGHKDIGSWGCGELGGDHERALLTKIGPYAFWNAKCTSIVSISQSLAEI